MKLPIALLLSLIMIGCSPLSSLPKDEVPQRYKIYFSNQEFEENDCSKVFPVVRDLGQVDVEEQYATVLQELFFGPTERDRQNGYSSFFSEQTEDILRSVRVEDGTAYVDLEDIRTIIPNASSSCGSATILAQISETLLQFPEVNQVILAINGDPQTFYEWIQMGCDESNDHCDPMPFQS